MEAKETEQQPQNLHWVPMTPQPQPQPQNQAFVFIQQQPQQQSPVMIPVPATVESVFLPAADFLNYGIEANDNCQISSQNSCAISNCATLLEDDNFDLSSSIPFTQILNMGLPDGSATAANLSQSGSNTTVEVQDNNHPRSTQTDTGAVATGMDEVNEMDKDFAVAQQRKKKRKAGLEMNKKAPGEKRKNKYYWAKIDDKKKPVTPKPKTPKPVTPKPKTPKPVTPKQKKYVKKKDVSSSKPLGQVLESTTKDSTCTRVLNFKDDEIANLNLDLGVNPLSCNSPEAVPVPLTPKPKRKYVRKKCGVAPDSNVLEQVVGKTIENSTCMEGLKVEDSKIASLDLDLNLSPLDCNFKEKSVEIQTLNLEVAKSTNGSDVSLEDKEREVDIRCESKITRKSIRVFRRKLGSKCLSTCRQLGLNFQENSKRRRKLRQKKSIATLKQLEGFCQFTIVKDVLDRIGIVRGKREMLLPTKAKIVPESLNCVLSLLNSSTRLRKKRRWTGRVRRTNFTGKITGKETAIQSGIGNGGKLSFKGLHNSAGSSAILLGAENEQGNELQMEAKERKAKSQMQHINPGQDDFSNQGSKAKATKQKKGHPPKRKAKHSDYLSGISNWHDESLEQFLDPFIQQFESLVLYDDPKTLERWSIMNYEEESKDDGMEETLEEKEKLENEKRELLERIDRFLYIMTQSQGPRDFVKWNGSVVDSVVGVFLTQNVSDVLSSNAYMELGSRYPLKPSSKQTGDYHEDSGINSSQGSSHNKATKAWIELPEEEETDTAKEEKTDTAKEEETDTAKAEETRSNVRSEFLEEEETDTTKEEETKSKEFDDALNEMLALFSDMKTGKSKGKQAEEREKIDWEAIRVKFSGEGQKQRSPDTQDSVDWEAVRKAPVQDIAKAIHGRGQNNIIAAKIKKTLNRIVEQHGSLDLEWLRQAPPEVAKAYLLSFYGLGLKSVECLRLLTLHHHAFPVDVNIRRIVIRLGWVPLQQLPMGMPFHLVDKYPLENHLQKYLWRRLSHLDQKKLYKLHYQMITFGKVFCVKKNPNCGACPFKGECKYYASVIASKLALPSPQERKTTKSKKAMKRLTNPFDIKRKSSPSPNLSLPASNSNSQLEVSRWYPTPSKICEPIVEMPTSPERVVVEPKVVDIEDLCSDNVKNEAEAEDEAEELFDIRLNTDEFKQTLRNYFEESHVPMKNDDELSRALVSLSPEATSLPLPKHMVNIRLRTEHQVYELPDFHPLLYHLQLEPRDKKDPLPYLLAIWPKGCDGGAEKSCSSSENTEEDSSIAVPGTILIPSRTAMRGFFALNGTYFQVNEVFVDDETCQCPFQVPREWLWNLPRRTLYCGSSTTSIFRGLTWQEIRRCCCEGFICTRGFNRKTRAPKPLPLRFHNRVKGKSQQNVEDDED